LELTTNEETICRIFCDHFNELPKKFILEFVGTMNTAAAIHCIVKLLPKKENVSSSNSKKKT
jgi:hypothetical protein